MEFPRRTRMVKLVVVAVLLVFGGIMDGSWKGILAWAMILGAAWFMWELIHYDPSRKPQQMIRTEQDFNDEPAQAIRGRRNPDPTRPTTDDWLGMATEYLNRKRGM